MNPSILKYFPPSAAPVFAVMLSVSAVSACEHCQTWGPFYKEMSDGMTTMDAGMMKANKQMTGNVDADFIRMMIPHHQGAIDMAKAEVLHGTDPALKNIAQEIIAEQGIEIAYMQKMAAQFEQAAPAKSAPAPESTPAPVLAPASQPLTQSVRAKQSDYVLVANEEPAKAKAEAGGPGKTEDYSHDRVYTCDQVSNTVSVIDPAQNKLLGIIKLGDLPPASLLPLYTGQSLVHGAGFSPDGKRLCVISIGSNSITLIDTATNKVLKTQYLGRAPHEAFFTPDGKEIYAAVRGEDYVSIMDAETLEEKARIKTNPGPGMILFCPDGKYAFVPSSFTPELCVIDTKTREVVARVPQASPFSPNLGVSADGAQVWFTLKDSGQTQVMSAEPPFALLGTLPSGPISNHVTCVDNAHGHFAYVTVGGLDQVKVYRREPPFALVDTISTGALPHGIWGAPDGSRVYIGLENDAKVQAIDTLENKVIATIPSGQLPQALVYVPNAARNGPGTDNLLPLSSLKESKTYNLRAREVGRKGRASLTVISLGLVSQVQLAASDLVPGQEYNLFLQEAADEAAGRVDIAKLKASPSGSAIVNTLSTVPAGANKKFVLEAESPEAIPALVQE